MPEFTYKASDRIGRIIEGSIEAPDDAAVIGKLRGMGFIPIRIEHASAGKGLARSLNFNLKFVIPSPFSKVSGKDLLSFTQELSTLIKSSLPLDRSLSVIAEITDNEHLKGITQELLKDVRGGKAFSEALAQHPRVFNRLYVNMIKAGEVGGVLDVVLERLLDFLERSQELKGTVMNAMIYPIVLSVVMGIVVAIMLIVVLPRFVGIFDTMHQQIPLPTQILLSFSVIVKKFWWLILGAGLALYAWFQSTIRTEKGKRTWDSFKLKVVFVRSLILKIEVARFSRTLGTLITSGVPLLQSLAIVKEIIGNVVIANSIASIQKAVKEGKGVSLPMRSSGLFPSLAMHMIRVGEETGKMEEMLIRVADTYDRDVQSSVKRFISLLEPMLILVMALFVGFIVLSIVLAIVSINDVSF
ncbi:MAG: type II secretion system F family protein [Pseudomonadota bacterium]